MASWAVLSGWCYNKLMRYVQKFFAGLTCALLPVALLAFGSLLSIYQTAGNAGSVKQAIAQSNVYDTVIDEGLYQLEQSTSQFTSNLPVREPQVRQVIERAVPPQMVQRQADRMVDGFYAWLDGSSPTVQLHIDLQEAKIRAADGISTYVAERLEQLPQCTIRDNLPLRLDPFLLSCLVPQIDQSAIVQQVHDEIMASRIFDAIPVPSLRLATPDEIHIGDLSINRKGYQQLQTTVYLTGMLAILLAVGVVVLSSSWRAGIRRLGIILVAVGVVGLLVAVGVDAMQTPLRQQLAVTLQAGIFEQSVLDVVRVLVGNLSSWWLWHGIGIGASGIVVLIILAITRRKTSAAAGAAAKPAATKASRAAKPTTKPSRVAPTRKQKHPRG